MEQRSLFYGDESLNPAPELKRAMSLALKQSGLSREQVADRMNAHITVERIRTRGKDGLVTEAMIDKWLAPEGAELIPLKLVKIFGTVMGSPGPAQALAPAGCRVIGPQELLLLEYGRAQMEKRRLNRRERRLAEQIEEMKK